MSSESTGLLEILRDKILPELNLRFPKKKRLLVVGQSMGGLNALIAGLSLNGYFQKIAALCSGVYIEPMFTADANTEAFIRRTTVRNFRKLWTVESRNIAA